MSKMRDESSASMLAKPNNLTTKIESFGFIGKRFFFNFEAKQFMSMPQVKDERKSSASTIACPNGFYPQG